VLKRKRWFVVQKAKVITTILKEVLDGFPDADIEFIIRAEELYPGISEKARDLADQSSAFPDLWSYMQAIHRQAVEDVQDHLMYIEVRCLYDMLLVVENGKIVIEEYEPEAPLSRKVQDLFVEYMVTRNLDIKEKFLKCVEGERFKAKR